MNRRTFSLLSGVFLLSLVTAVPVYSQGMDMGEAINQAGRQRMLTQRIVKDYAMVGLGVDVAVAKKQMQDAVALFEQQLQNLRRFAPNQQINADLDKVEQRWQPFRELALQPVSREQAVQLRELADETLAAAHQVVLSLQAVSGTSLGQLVNMAGRQRMLSQRLAGLYLYRAWGIEQEALEADYATAMNEFDTALKTLQAAPENTRQIDKALKKVADNWFLYQRSGKLRNGDFIPLLIEQSSERILVKMNAITGQYAALADSGN